MCGLPAFPPESVQRPLSLPLGFQFPWSSLRSVLSCERSRPALPRRAGGLGFPPPAPPCCPAAASSWRWTCCFSGFHDTALSHDSPLGSDSSFPPWHPLPASLVGVLRAALEVVFLSVHASQLRCLPHLHYSCSAAHVATPHCQRCQNLPSTRPCQK